MKKLLSFFMLLLFVGTESHADAMVRRGFNGYGPHHHATTPTYTHPFYSTPIYYVKPESPEEKAVRLKNEEITSLKEQLFFQSVLIEAQNKNKKFFLITSSNYDSYSDSYKTTTGIDEKLINLRDKNGRTLLHHAAAAGNSDACKFLLDNKADVAAEDADGKTPLHLVAENGKNIACIWLVHAAKFQHKSHLLTLIDNDKRNTPLHLALQNKHVSAAAYLMLQGAYSSATNRDGFTQQQIDPITYDAARKECEVMVWEQLSVWRKIAWFCCGSRRK